MYVIEPCVALFLYSSVYMVYFCNWTLDYLREFSKKIRNNRHFIGLLEDDWWKKHEAKNLTTLSL